MARKDRTYLEPGASASCTYCEKVVVGQQQSHDLARTKMYTDRTGRPFCSTACLDRQQVVDEAIDQMQGEHEEMLGEELYG